jgi:hypothetical protein
MRTPNTEHNQPITSYKGKETPRVQRCVHRSRKFPEQYHIETNVKPVHNNPRRVPVPVKHVVKDLIKTRVCLDSLHLNKAVIKNHYPIPNTDHRRCSAETNQSKGVRCCILCLQWCNFGISVDGQVQYNKILIEFRDSLGLKRWITVQFFLLQPFW